MQLNITYKDARRHHAVQCDEIQSKTIIDFVKNGMIIHSDFDLLEIDLSEMTETVRCYSGGQKVCEFGGASAWGIYKSIASIWPQINYYAQPCSHS